MASSYPGALDSFTNPTATDSLNSATVPHATQHANANDAIEAIQAELGTDPAGAAATVKARFEAIEATGWVTSTRILDGTIVDGDINAAAAIAQSKVANLTTDLAGKAASVHTHAQADVTNLTTDLAAKAPLASPTFTGTPTLPTGTIATTQTQGNNSTAIATTAYVDTLGGTKAPLTCLWLPGVNSNYASTPNAAALNVAGNLDVTVDFTVGATGAVQILVGKDQSGQRAWNLQIDALNRIMFETYNGTTKTGNCITSTTVSLNTRYTVRVLKDTSTTGAVIYLGGVAQSEAADTVPTGAITSVTSAVEIGSNFAGANPFKGRIHSVTIKDGSTIVASPVFTAPMGTRTRDPQGNVWTINGSAWAWEVV